MVRPAPHHRLARRPADPAFLAPTAPTAAPAAPTAALAAPTAALSAGVGFLPVSGRAAGLGTVATGATVSVLAACAAVVQPRAGRALDEGRLSTRSGLTAGLLLTAAGLGCAMQPGLTGILTGAALTGAGVGLITPLGFAALAAATPAERLGQTMGAAELGRGLGAAGGPLPAAAVATATTLTHGFAALAVLTAAGPVIQGVRRRPGR